MSPQILSVCICQVYSNLSTGTTECYALRGNFRNICGDRFFDRLAFGPYHNVKLCCD